MSLQSGKVVDHVTIVKKGKRGHELVNEKDCKNNSCNVQPSLPAAL